MARMTHTRGLVLAGGRSTRFGSEKAVARIGGEPMIARVVRVLASGCEMVAVNAPTGSGAAAWARAAGLEVLPDPPGAPDGPLAGVLTGLVWAEARGADLLAISPCDTPRLPRDLVARLQADLGDASAAVAVTRDGGQPLCAILRTSLRARLQADLAQGAHPAVRAWLDSVSAVGVAFEDARAFQNVNRPAPPPA